MSAVEARLKQSVIDHGRPGVVLAAMVFVVLGAAVAVGVFIDGGFKPEVRGAFAAFAGAGLLLAVAVDGTRALAVARSLPALSLIGLAIVTAASAAWTLGEPVRALRWSLAIAGYAALMISTAVVSSRNTRPQAAAIACVAVAAGTVALAGIALRQSPLALHLAGEWEAAGPFQYPPALALLEIAALPILVTAGVREKGWIALAAAAGLAVATMSIALSGSRVSYALALGLLALAILFPARTVGTSRRSVAGLVVCASALPVVALIFVDLGNPDTAISGDVGRVSVLLAVISASVLAASRLGVGQPGTPTAGSRTAALKPSVGLAILLAVVGLAFAGSAFAERQGHGVERIEDWSHGRVTQWKAAIDTIGDHPVAGVGGDAYFRGSRTSQGEDPSLYAHSLPLEVTAELGAAGALLIGALYLGVGRLTWRVRKKPEAWLFGPAAVLFLVTNLFDWPWHLVGLGAVWAIAVGAMLGRAG